MATTRKQAILKQVGRATFIALAWAVALAVVAAWPARAQTFKSLYSFTGGSDGWGPNGPLIWDASGNLYGTVNSSTSAGNGTIFKLSPSGKLKVLYTFPGQGGNGSNGANPNAGLVRNSEGNLYGLTGYGGDGCTGGCGVVFKLTPSGNETVLHAFESSPNDGALPMFSTLLPGPHNVFYGLAFEGGDGVCVYGKQGICGVAFSVDTSGNEKIIYNFQGSPYDGMGPLGSLVEDAKGNLYGTTFGGGSYPGTVCGGLGDNYGWNCGTIFKLSPNSDGTWTESILYSLDGTDGRTGRALAIDRQGNLYGIATFGGNSKCIGGCGTLYKLDVNGSFTVLHSFAYSDGESPQDVIVDAAGNLYGSMLGGNSKCEAGCGLVYVYDTAGKFSVLHKFKDSDGNSPGLLSFDEKTGTLYGTTGGGGVYGWGTIFEITSLKNPRGRTQ